MKNRLLSLLGVVACSGFLYAQEAPDQFPDPGAREENHTMKITARVIDENGAALPDTPIRIGIHNVNDFKDEYHDFRGKTDAEGKFSAEGIGRGLAEIEVRKDGYYLSKKTYYCNQGTTEEIRKEGKFFPWNPVVDLVVKKLGKPIPMIVRLAWGDCKSWIRPKKDQLKKDIGWDLVEGEWIPPHGKGKVADLFFKFESSYTDESNKSAEVNIRFGNPNDGLIVLKELKGDESLLKFPREAPREGYSIKNFFYSTKFEDGTLVSFPENRPKGYLLRIRTLKDDDGKIVSAMYLKITKPFELQPPAIRYRLPLLDFDYYLNPTPNDRNLEYDQRNNLAPEADKDLTWPP